MNNTASGLDKVGVPFIATSTPSRMRIEEYELTIYSY